MKVSLESGVEERQKNPEAFLIPEELLPSLQAACVDKIKEFAASSKLAHNKKVGYILYRWREWGSEGELREWVEKLVETDEGLLNLLKSFVRPVTSQSLASHVPRVTWRLNLKVLEPFVSVEEVARRVDRLDPDKLGAEETRAVKAFRQALTRRQAGKSEGGWWPEED